MENQNAPDTMMTVAEVADYLGFKPTTIYSYIKKGQIPVYKASGRWRFKFSEIEEWLKENTRKNDDILENLTDVEPKESVRERRDVDMSELGVEERGLELLFAAEILKGISPAEEEILRETIKCEEKHYSDGDIVIFDTQKMNYFYIIEEGTLSIPVGGAEGEVTSKQDYKKGNIMGLDVMMTQDRTSYFTAKAKGEVTLMAYPYELFLNRRHTSDALKVKILTNIAGLLADENIRRMKRIGMNQVKSLRGRIISYLLQSEKKAGGSPFEIKDNRSEMARHLGMNRSVLSNELSMLKKDGIIDFKKRTFNILADRYELEKLIESTGRRKKKSAE